MLYYVLVRSEDQFKMQYNSLIELLDAISERKSKNNTERKQRPESTSAAKLKMRNQGKIIKESLEEQMDENEENFPEEEIADDTEDREESHIEEEEPKTEEPQPENEGEPQVIRQSFENDDDELVQAAIEEDNRDVKDVDEGENPEEGQEEEYDGPDEDEGRQDEEADEV